MAAMTITNRGQVTIPKEVRDYLGVRQGDRLEFTIDRKKGDVKIRASRGKLDELYGLLERRNASSVSVEEMTEGVQDLLAADDERIRREQR